MRSGAAQGFAPIRDAWLARAAAGHAHPGAAGDGGDDRHVRRHRRERRAAAQRRLRARQRAARRRSLLSGKPCCSRSTPATPTSSSPSMTARQMRAQWRAVTETTRTADEYAVWLSQLLALQGLSFADLDAADHRHRGAGGAVRSAPALPQLSQMRAADRGRSRRSISASKVNVDRPAAVGADRLVNTVAAHERYKGARDRGRFRHRHHFRHRGREWRLSKAA